MKKILALFAAILVPVALVFAQDDLLGELQKEDSAKVKQDIATASFKSTRIINMHSTEITGYGNMQFMIIHHFGEIWNEKEGGSNFARLFGMNGNVANTYMSFDYTPIQWLNLGVGFAGLSNLEGFAKIKLLRQQTGIHNYPVSIVWLANANFNASKSVEAPNDFNWNKFSYLNQLLVSRKFNEKFSLQVMPSIVHRNIISYGYGNKHSVYSFGIGGRYKINEKKALTFEYTRQFNMYENVIDKTSEIVSYSPNLFSLGWDWDTGGHIFQFFVTNSTFATNINQMTVNPKRTKLGQLSLGFNLNRSYAVKKAVKTH
ncbi:MAG: DUF5777 family beta-barrel protein [Ferruginibacter sp.]